MATRPTLLSVLFTAIFTTGFAYAAEDQPPQVENAKFNFAGVVNADSVLVRSGPSDNYYITGKLAKGTPVTVVGIKFEWLKIVPPEGSFSVVAKNFVTRDANATTGRINADNVNIRAGSSVVPLKVTVQCKLPKGADVTIVGEDDAYYQIKPPADAYLYVSQKFVEPLKQVANAAPARPIVKPIEKVEKKTDDANIELVKTQEKRFVDFFNNSQPVTPRMHSLELLPGIGKKSMWQVVNMRERKPFASYKDIQERTGLSDIPKITSKRIIEELSTDSKYRLFTRTV